MTGQANFVAAAQHRAVDGRDDGLTVGFHPAKRPVQPHRNFQHLARILILIAQNHFQICPGDELRLSRGDDDAFHRRISVSFFQSRLKFWDGGIVEDIHRGRFHVPRDEGDVLV